MLVLLGALAPAIPVSAATQPSPAAHSAGYAPKTAQHAEYTVDVNAKGQVVRIRSAKHAADPWFDKRVAGNALQVFIRAPDGTAVSGIYRLTYDYNPVKKTVTRKVTLVQEGGVDPNAVGAFAKIEQKAAASLHPASPLPDFSAIVNKK